jgi:phage gpG-like protein
LTVEFQIDDAAARRLLAQLANRAGNLRDPLGSFAQNVQTRIALSFRGSSDPWGGAWQPLKAITIARRRRGSSKPLVDTGELSRTATVRPRGPIEVEVSVGRSDRPASIHQFGGRAGRRLAATIPARPMLPIRPGGDVDLPPTWMADLTALVRAHLKAPA